MAASALVVFFIMILFVSYFIFDICNSVLNKRIEHSDHVPINNRGDTGLLEELKGIAFSRADAEIKLDLTEKMYQIKQCDDRLLSVSNSIRNTPSNNITLIK